MPDVVPDLANLLPFAVRQDTGECVDVHTVHQGARCGCLCPSCKAPLIARQGAIKVWHFAHQAGAAGDTPRIPCEYAFERSVRRMIVQMLMEGTVLRIPSRRTAGGELRQAKVLTLGSPQENGLLCGVKVDVLGVVPATSRGRMVPLGIFVTWAGRDAPPALRRISGWQGGVVELNLQNMTRRFRDASHGSALESLRLWLSLGVADKFWIYPRDCPPERLCIRLDRAPQAFQPAVAVKKAYHCLFCKTRWRGTSRYCPSCKNWLGGTEDTQASGA